MSHRDAYGRRPYGSWELLWRRYRELENIPLTIEY